MLAVVWAIVAAFGAVRGARAQPPDPMAQLEAEFSTLPGSPAAGEVVTSSPMRTPGGGCRACALCGAVRAGAAVVLSRVGHEFMIVAHGMPRPGGDPRLDGFPGVGDARGSPGLSAPGSMIAAAVGLFLPIGAAWWGLRALACARRRIRGSRRRPLLLSGHRLLPDHLPRGVVTPVSGWAFVTATRRCGWRSARPAGGRAADTRASAERPGGRAGAFRLAGARRIRGGRRRHLGPCHRVPGGSPRAVGRGRSGIEKARFLYGAGDGWAACMAIRWAAACHPLLVSRASPACGLTQAKS